jgi:hypothetical protein
MKSSLCVFNAGERDIVPVFFDSLTELVEWLSKGSQQIPTPFQADTGIKTWRVCCYIYQLSETEK